MDIQPEIFLESISNLKANASRIFASKGFPGPKNEDYKYLNFGNLHQLAGTHKMGWEQGEINLPLSIDAFQFVYINGVFKPEFSKLEGLPKTVFFGQIEQGFADVPVLSRKIGSLADVSDGFVAFNSANFNYGYALHVSRGTNLEKPLYILNFFTGKEAGMPQPRNFVFLEENTTADLYVHCFGSDLEADSFFNSVTEIVLSAGSVLNYTQIQEGGKALQTVDYLICDLQKSSTCNHTSVNLSGKLVRNNTQLLLNGKGAEGNMYGVFIPGSGEIIDNHTLADHRVADCPSNELYKGVVIGDGTGVFNGKIFVRQDAQKTNAFQSNKNLLLSDEAAIFTKPQLEIYADDVKCSHGSSTGQLDEKALFYLQSRGIGLEAATQLLVSAFSKEILEKIKNEQVIDYLINAIETKLRSHQV